MAGFLAILPLVLKYVPPVVSAIESLFGAGKGSAKRSAAVTVTKALILALEGFKKEDIVDDDAFAEGIGKVVDGVVQVYNSVGAFKHGS